MDFQEQYDALVRSDPAYEGRFIAAVRTTGIFCRPTCRARKPRPENVEFFPTVKEALLAGYRPCKLCHPLDAREPVPAMIQGLLEDVDNHPTVRITDRDLRARGLDPDTVRTWFKKHHGLTFQGYQRARRLAEAFGRIRQGETVAQAALGSGFDSLSAFGESFRRAFGEAPTKTPTQKVLRVTRLETPLGLMVAAETEGRLCLLEFADRRSLENELAAVELALRARALAGSSPVFDELRAQLEQYFARTRRDFALPLFWVGSEFQSAVWQALTTIPYGQTRSYAEQAALVGRPAAVRAVGTANGANRLSIVVPCHRVLGADGELTGYGGGLWRKRWLLDLEAGKLGSL